MSQAPKTPPAEFDRHALEIARGMSHLKLDGMQASKRVSVIHAAIVESMMLAAEATESRACAHLGVTIHGNTIRLNGVRVNDVEMAVLRTIADRVKQGAEVTA